VAASVKCSGPACLARVPSGRRASGKPPLCSAQRGRPLRRRYIRRASAARNTPWGFEHCRPRLRSCNALASRLGSHAGEARHAVQVQRPHAVAEGRQRQRGPGTVPLASNRAVLAHQRLQRLAGLRHRLGADQQRLSGIVFLCVSQNVSEHVESQCVYQNGQTSVATGALEHESIGQTMRIFANCSVLTQVTRLTVLMYAARSRRKRSSRSTSGLQPPTAVPHIWSRESSRRYRQMRLGDQQRRWQSRHTWLSTLACTHREHT